MRRIERGQPDQPMNTLLPFQVAVGIRSPDLEGRTPDPGDVAGARLEENGREPHSLSETPAGLLFRKYTMFSANIIDLFGTISAVSFSKSKIRS